MMGERRVTQALFHEFSLDRHVPADHLLRANDRFCGFVGYAQAVEPIISSYPAAYAGIGRFKNRNAPP